MSLGDDKFCFIEDVKNPLSCTIMVKGANQHIIEQIKDACATGCAPSRTRRRRRP